MTRRVGLLSTMLLILNAPCVLALDHGSVRIALNAGIAASTAPEEYGGLMVLPGTGLAVGGGVGRALVGPVLGVADASYFRVGPGQFMGRTFYTDPIMEPSSALTAMVGLELAERDQASLAPFVSGAFGVGHVLIGDMNGNQGGAMLTERPRPMTAPAFAFGVGLRTPATPSGLRATLGIRWV